ncbi:hypothetical protein D9756_010726 [Leucocoprinus leucothites]|uniref:Uncharacterized protein n=1 Tax=Leucocoprinus leucothites TaxID=201217 RepID=A0A8H5FTF3_9AGAR|nr:hypothetical protein D9756_010726 [Leucoagaricus leucothites]
MDLDLHYLLPEHTFTTIHDINSAIGVSSNILVAGLISVCTAPHTGHELAALIHLVYSKLNGDTGAQYHKIPVFQLATFGPRHSVNIFYSKLWDSQRPRPHLHRDGRSDIRSPPRRPNSLGFFFIHVIRGVKQAYIHDLDFYDPETCQEQFFADAQLAHDVALTLGVDREMTTQMTRVNYSRYDRDPARHLVNASGFRLVPGRNSTGIHNATYLQAYTTDKSVTYNIDGTRRAKSLTVREALGQKQPYRTIDAICTLYPSARLHYLSKKRRRRCAERIPTLLHRKRVTVCCFAFSKKSLSIDPSSRNLRLVWLAACSPVLRSISPQAATPVYPCSKSPTPLRDPVEEARDLSKHESRRDMTDPFGEVYDPDKQALVVQQLVRTPQRVSLVKAANNEWSSEKAFRDSDFVAAGQLMIPPDYCKPTKATKDDTYPFYVIEGATNFKVHKVSKAVATALLILSKTSPREQPSSSLLNHTKAPKYNMEPSGSAPPQRRENNKSLEEVRLSSRKNRGSATVGGGRAA